MSDWEDVFIEDEKMGEKKIAEIEWSKTIEDQYEIGYHGGLIGGLEAKENEVLLSSMERAFHHSR